jgi:hypothetical protein
VFPPQGSFFRFRVFLAGVCFLHGYGSFHGLFPFIKLEARTGYAGKEQYAYSFSASNPRKVYCKCFHLPRRNKLRTKQHGPKSVLVVANNTGEWCFDADDGLSAIASLRHHWPEYLMEAGELGCYLFVACAVATLLHHPGSPVRQSISSGLARRALMGLAMGATAIGFSFVWFCFCVVPSQQLHLLLGGDDADRFLRLCKRPGVE